jgi:hypothetical protein
MRHHDPLGAAIEDAGRIVRVMRGDPGDRSLPADVHSYALLPIGYPMGRFGPVRRVPVADIVYEDRWGQPYQDQ